ncbi:hypothetical protein [Nostoc sp.]
MTHYEFDDVSYFWLICDRTFDSKPRNITQTQFRRNLLTNQYS